VLGHLGINVADLRAAKTYYDAVMPVLGFDEFFAAADEFAYRPAGGKPGSVPSRPGLSDRDEIRCVNPWRPLIPPEAAGVFDRIGAPPTRLEPRRVGRRTQVVRRRN
jgi:catechol 2,3-dioxygenase-like lactoylglutathione lyase family enzyme